jgi:cytochrome c-type biogenesis protein CcmH/NrfF
VKVIDSVVIALEAEAENDLVRRVVPWRRYGHRLMVRHRLKLLLRLWPVALVILNFVVLAGVVREHGFEDKHLLDIVNDLLERDFFVSGLFLIPLLVASVPLFLFFRL